MKKEKKWEYPPAGRMRFFSDFFLFYFSFLFVDVLFPTWKTFFFLCVLSVWRKSCLKKGKDVKNWPDFPLRSYRLSIFFFYFILRMQTPFLKGKKRVNFFFFIFLVLLSSSSPSILNVYFFCFYLPKNKSKKGRIFFKIRSFRGSVFLGHFWSTCWIIFFFP